MSLLAELLQTKLSYNGLFRLMACGQTHCMPGVEPGITPWPLEMRNERETTGSCFTPSEFLSVFNFKYTKYTMKSYPVWVVWWSGNCLSNILFSIF